jgi:hypothetical protein
MKKQKRKIYIKCGGGNKVKKKKKKKKKKDEFKIIRQSIQYLIIE